MAFDKRLQAQRFELKYIISEDVALAVRDFVSSYLEIDEYGATRPNLSYPVHSLYLDSDELKLYWDTVNGTKNRYKLRLRFYENRPKAPVYFEIKRRMNNTILKQRAAVHRDAVSGIIAGHLPDPSQMVSKDPRHLVALQRFCELMQMQHAKPKAHIAYVREAWISPNNNAVRVTMDRDVRSEPEFTTRLTTEMTNPLLVFGRKVILELKFTDRFPDWFRKLVELFGVTQCSAAKYADGIVRGGERRYSPGYFEPMEPEGLERQEKRSTHLRRLDAAAPAMLKGSR